MKMIFVGGLQRSGTTLIGRVLAEHPGVTGLTGTGTREDEGQFVQRVYPNDHEMGRRLTSVGQAVRWAFHPEAHLTEEDVSDPDRVREDLLNAWTPYMEDKSASSLVEKSPSNLMKTRFLQAVFPDAGFVVITRHPIAQALAVRKWGTYPMRSGFRLGRIVQHWLLAMETFRDDSSFLVNRVTCSYEQLVASPARTIQDFFGAVSLDSPDLQLGVTQESTLRYAAYSHRFRNRDAGGVPLEAVRLAGKDSGAA